MNRLNTLLEIKEKDVTKLIRDFEVEIKEISKEIKKSDLSYEEAVYHFTTYQKLCLLQRKEAYKNELEIINKNIIQGIEELYTKIDESYTDLRMIETIGQRETEKLYSEIDNVLNNYSQFAVDKTIDASLLKTRPLPEVWQTYINN
ncbi:MAG: hypothetical protein Q7T50_00505 [Candidatus Magasanikbacteria bacterium]|nr:hypothetical protein [Candidatus Magasanikbacteria bacterium]